MVNRETLEEYSNSIRRLKQECTENGMSDEQFKKLYLETLRSIEIPVNLRSFDNRHNYNNQLRKYVTFILVGVVLALIIFNYKNVYSCAAFSLQDYIYPGLKLLRKLSIPFVSLFPSLTALYHETCLIQNPFFTVVDMDCWPCSSVNSIIEIYDPKPVTELQTTPFIYETDQNVIGMEGLKKLYLGNKELFDNEASKLQTGSKTYIDPNQMFLQYQSGDKQSYIWKFNNMNVAKALRQAISRPKVVPKFGQSTERFIVVDTSQDSFRMPDTECSFSFLLSLSGSRTINLEPAEECRHQCKTLKVELRETYLLWYNWWYWRPIVQPSNGNTTFIAHIGSYC